VTSFDQEVVSYWENSALDGRIYGVGTPAYDEDSPHEAGRPRSPSDKSEPTSPPESNRGLD
jgi:hypothetical protein